MNPFNYKITESSLLMNSEGKILDANPPAVEMIGLSKEEILGRSCYEVIEGRDLAGNLFCFEGCAVMKMAGRKEPVNNYEMRMTTHDGRKQRLNVSTLLESGPGADAHPKILHVFRPAASLIQIADVSEGITETKRLETELHDKETRFSGIIDIAPEAILTTDDTLKILSFNKGAEKIFGYDAAEVIGRPLDLLIPQRYAEKHSQRVQNFGAADGPPRMMSDARPQVAGLRKDGTEFPAEVSISKWKSGDTMLYAAILRDVTERKRVARREAARFEQLKQLSELGMMLSGDPAVVFERVVRMIGELFEVRVVCLSEISGRELFFKAVYVDGRVISNAGGCPLDITPCATVEETKDLRLYDRVQERFPQASFLRDHNAFSYCGFPALDNDGRVVAVTCLLDDKPHEFSVEDQQLLQMIGQRIALEIERNRIITERKQVEDRVQRLAYYDSLTDLPNRTYFKELLQEAILRSQYEEKPLAVVLIDLDHFKEINDTLGHHRGDFLLQQVGMRLKDVLRPDDTISRLGGDEFGMVLPLAASEDAAGVADKVMKKLDEPFIIEGLPIAVELSMGIALYPDHGESADSLMQRADVALYVAKKSGRGHILYAPEHDRHSPRRLALLGELKRAIETSQVYLEYQPKITLSTGRMVGLEALARWKHPDLGAVPPDEFIPPAEQTGMIKPLTAFILDQALRQLRDWRKIDPAITIAVNLSVRNLLDPKLPDQISEMLQTHGVPPDGLVLEITESGIMTDAQAALSTISLLVGRGIHCSIDDFGIGQSSLSYLKKLPVSSIKIDRAFVTHMATDMDDEMIVRSTIDLAHNLGRRVIAEGVEDWAVFKRLVELDCDEAQGFYISTPIPAVEINSWLNRFFKPPTETKHRLKPDDGSKEAKTL